MLPHMLFPTRVCLLLSLVLAFSASADLRITHGPMLGRPGTDSMGIWIRTSEPGEFTVQTGLKDGKWDGPTIKGITRLDSDCTGWVELKKLKPRTKYNYRVITKDDESAPTGTFSTLADNKIQANAEHNPEGLFNFSFEFACGNNQNPLHGIGPSLPTYTTMLKEIRDKVDFAILNGDWLYEEQREYPYNQWLKQVGISDAEAPHDVKIVPTISSPCVLRTRDHEGCTRVALSWAGRNGLRDDPNACSDDMLHGDCREQGEAEFLGITQLGSSYCTVQYCR